MSSLSSRLYEHPEDLQRMGDLIRAVRPGVRLTDYPSIRDFQEIMHISSVRANTRLWFEHGASLQAFAVVDAYHNLLFELLPGPSSSEIESQIVAWGVECLRRECGASEEAFTLDAGCRLDDAARLDFLRRHGFRELPQHSLSMERSLGGVLPDPCLPPAYHIRAVAGEHEDEQWVALHRAAFGTDHMTVEERQAMTQVPDYDPALDLVAVTESGTLAAYCFCSIEWAEDVETGPNIGYTDPIATHPDHQRKGLARALMAAGLRLLKERGLNTVRLGTSSENIAMQRVAESLGFQTRDTRLWFEKDIS